MEVDATDPEVTLQFYKRLYPFKQVFTWLNQGHKPINLFHHREFAFTLIGDTYLRYHSFSKWEELRDTTIRYNPTRFEIGAIYNARPRDRKTLPPGSLKPLQRELVFDIDMTDYDEVRTCCSGKGICQRCWAFISAAVEVLDPALREEFGFKHLLWVYSGRRGIHCWVSDRAALALTDDERRAITSYLEVIKGGAGVSKKVNVRDRGGKAGLHPALKAAYDRLSAGFIELILEDQKCFDDRKGWESLLELIPQKDIVSTLRNKWESEPNRSSKKKWGDFVAFVHKDQNGTLTPIAEDIVLQYIYPRIDANVSKHRNHLLKAPFCIHPGTGRICVPVDPSQVREFDPLGVPTIATLLKELETGSTDQHHSDWERTSLKPYVDMLERHSKAIMADQREAREAAMASSMTF